jgi:4-phosphopantoate--beta-alanine ligase
MPNEVPHSHPRRVSLELRDRLIAGLDKKVVAQAGLFAHGRGEAFDYILGEETTAPALKAITAAAALLLSAKKPVISVNGNAAALCPADVVALARAVLRAHGADKVLGIGAAASATVPGLTSARTHVDPDGIYGADVVFLALEDGDRTEWLVKMGKRVIAVDLNPFSRTAQFAGITIVDNLARALPLLVKTVAELSARRDPTALSKLLKSYDNKKVLSEAIGLIHRRLRRLARRGVFLEVPRFDGTSPD